MPKVKMKTSMAGLDYSISYGEVVEVKDDVAKSWVENGIADLVQEEVPKKKTSLKKGDK